MARRKTKNRTGLKRKEGIGASVHDAWVGYVCLKCKTLNTQSIGQRLLNPKKAYETESWTCSHCGYVHSKDSPLPYTEWLQEFTETSSIACQRFWESFFRVATEHPESYWKQCNSCDRVLPASAFSRHKDWGPLEKQMECRPCKGVINAKLNPKRTKQQLLESSVRRRVADSLVKDENQTINIDELFERFDGKCFKTGKKLSKKDRKSWAIDHILPSRYLYPLRDDNAALLSREANNNKRDAWPSQFYTNSELITLAKLTGANLTLLSSKKPLVNKDIDVNRCVERYLQVREHSKLNKRIAELKKVLEEYELVGELTAANKKLLGY